MKKFQIVAIVVALTLVITTIAIAAPPLSGAIFTTTVDGTIVNENVRYKTKLDVYLDGGPGPNAPASAAGLPEGDYYFQVTDPSGKDLLSTDHISCRMIHVNADGVIDFVYAGTNYNYVNGQVKSWVGEPCQHEQGVDVDHSELGAITVQLYPFDDTPNKGGVYKAWITPVEDYACDPAFDLEADKKAAVNNEDCTQFHGFIPAASKTDNYKVKEPGPPYIQPEITVRKFHDANLNCVQDEGEADITGWEVSITDPLGVTNVDYTEVLLLASEGLYTIVEDTPLGTLQTSSFLDGALSTCVPAADPTVEVIVAGDSGETHEVVFGNVGIDDLTVCKVYDFNADGVVDAGEVTIAGWPITLTGTDVTGADVGPTTLATESDGCVTFEDLLPGTYVVTEAVPSGWYASGPVTVDCTVASTVSGSAIVGSTSCVDQEANSFAGSFTNYCTGTADFDTKGYWHNKNGLQEIDPEFVETYVNLLDPYDDPTSYFGDGDEPFDGQFEDGTPVAPAFNDYGDPIWGAGTMQAEISLFLVDDNAGGGGGDQEQLAQQLLAFIFNTEYRLGGDGAIQLSDGSFVLASDLIAQAIAAWQSGTPEEMEAMKTLLDGFNNNDAVVFIPEDPAYCPSIEP